MKISEIKLSEIFDDINLIDKCKKQMREFLTGIICVAMSAGVSEGGRAGEVIRLRQTYWLYVVRVDHIGTEYHNCHIIPPVPAVVDVGIMKGDVLHGE